ncbi:hypothetical protein QBC39DRAFT_345688 [Podospora conica]|nr:hypothetical protein QBC39DRAFT_345688 [Schizothecium conicum]
MARLTFGALLSALLLSGVQVAAQTTACSPPTWTLDDVKINFNTPSLANFTLSNDATGTSDVISCNLQFATFCELRGTASEKDLYLHLQVKNEDVWVNVTSSYTCDGKSGRVGGIGEAVAQCALDKYDCAPESIVVKGAWSDW